MPFRTELKTDWVENFDRIILENPLEYWDERSHQLFVIPEGFVTDCASIPQFLWSVLGHPFGKNIRKASTLHDFLYRNNVVKRKVADQMFYDALVDEGMDQDRAQVYYSGVRIGGSKAYQKGEEICDIFIPY